MHFQRAIQPASTEATESSESEYYKKKYDILSAMFVRPFAISGFADKTK